MIKLKSLLKEEPLENPDDSDQWDDWHDYLYEIEYGIDKLKLAKLIKKHNLSGKKYFNGKIIKIWDTKQEAYLEYDITAGTADLIKDIVQWIYDLSNSNQLSLGIDPDTIYNGHVDCSLKDLRENPGKVYHYTTEERWEKIQESGQIIGSSGTGINNQWAHGIFTSVNPEEYSLGSYGDICLELNLQQFKEDNNLKELNLSFEPQVEEYLVREYVRAVLEIEGSPDDMETDISPYTVIVGQTIPIKYIRQI